jgi:hypothetical protein
VEIKEKKAKPAAAKEKKKDRTLRKVSLRIMANEHLHEIMVLCS